MLGIVALDQQACLFKLHPVSVHVCPPCTRSLAKGSADIFTITHVWLCGTVPAHMSENQVVFLQQLQETSMPVSVQSYVLNFALNQQACLLQLHSTTWQVGYN